MAEVLRLVLSPQRYVGNAGSRAFWPVWDGVLSPQRYVGNLTRSASPRAHGGVLSPQRYVGNWCSAGSPFPSTVLCFKPSKVRWEPAILEELYDRFGKVLSPQRYVGNPGSAIPAFRFHPVLSPQRYVGNSYLRTPTSPLKRCFKPSKVRWEPGRGCLGQGGRGVGFKPSKVRWERGGEAPARLPERGFKPSKVRWELLLGLGNLTSPDHVLSPQRYVGNPGPGGRVHPHRLPVLSPQRYVGNGNWRT